MEETTLTDLFLQIEMAEQERDEALAIADAIAELSKNFVASQVLLKELQIAAVTAELTWQRIEQMPEFKERYRNREEARADYLRLYFAK